ncbi:MAG: CoA transferase, partial [Desulfobacterales bacterium]
LAEDPRFSSFRNRASLENEEALQNILEELSAQYTADEVIDRVQPVISKKEGRAAAVVTGKVTSPQETLNEDNWWNRGSFTTVKDPVYSELTLQGQLWKMSETPLRIKWVCRPIGADNSYIYLKYLGFGKKKLAKLKKKGSSNS